MWLFISNLNSLTFKHLKFLAQAFLNLLNGLNPGFSISLIVRSSRLGKKKAFIVSDVSATYTAAIIIICL